MSTTTTSSTTMSGERSRHPRLSGGRILTYLTLIVLAIVIGFPFYWMLLLSFTPESQIYRWPIEFLHTNLTLENYREIFTRQDLQIPRWFFNSALIATVETILALLVCSMAAYGFARLTFPGRDLLFFSLLFALMIPAQVTLIPTFLLVRNFGWLDTYQGVILPGVASVFSVFLMRQFFLAVPIELEEAALIDGAGRFRIYWQIVLPLTRAGLVAVTIFIFLGSWNNLFWPLIVLNRLEMRTLTVGLTVLRGTYGGDQMGLVMAGAAVASIPILIFYAVFQRQILKSVMMTGLKG
ncbi:MAG: carbohydrate ABC transporter permease [Anaerolineae bacterium]|nr:carbohydrate ABC transporter permease [Anaerolineae bacterium]